MLVVAVQPGRGVEDGVRSRRWTVDGGSGGGKLQRGDDVVRDAERGDVVVDAGAEHGRKPVVEVGVAVEGPVAGEHDDRGGAVAEPAKP